MEQNICRSLILYIPASLLSFSVTSLERPQQSSGCCLLTRLPLELLFGVLEDLSTLDRILLNETCSQFRELLHLPSLPFQACPLPSTLSLEGHNEYLARISRGILDKWACEECHTLHDCDPKDIPGTFISVCPARTEGQLRLVEGDRLFSSLWPRYRHVQQALKLNRQQNLDPRHQQHLVALISPLHRVRPRGYRRWDACDVFPKIVQGRFLLKTVRYYENRDRSKPRELCSPITSDFQACPHQHLRSDDLFTGYWHVHRRQHQAFRARDPTGFPALPHEEIETAVDVAYLLKGEVIERSCPQCPTDISAQMSKTSAVLCVWSYLGPETSINDEVWNVYKDVAPRPAYPYWDKGIRHKPGSIKKLYERTN